MQTTAAGGGGGVDSNARDGDTAPVTLTLHFHPFSSFCQKALVAFYERDVPFERRVVDLRDPDERAALEALWPMVKFPVLRDEAAERTIAEASLIVEYLDRCAPRPPLVPADEDSALDVRLWDRVFDLYVHMPMQKVVADTFRPGGAKDAYGVEEAKRNLAQAYAMIDRAIAERETEWMCGDAFTLADCAAAPALFYANIVAPVAAHRRLSAYYARLLARPSFARAVEEARPYRGLFPLEWPPEY